jgi:ribosomal protein S12 methylthiotransferase
VHEIILIGQDTGIWAHDLDTCPSPSPHNLAQLLDTLAVCFPHTWFRVMYLQPQGVTGELLATMAAHPNICRYLDIPLQHASARILRAMNRAGSGQDYLARIRTIREALPGVTLRTSLIAGFPGETREDARELEHFVDDAQLDYAGVFVYSREDGTPAGECANQVPLRTRRARAQRLRDRADVAGFARAAAQVGSEAEVLVCGVDDEGPWGRTKGQAPEVDGVTHLDTGVPGSVVRARIVQASCYELYAEAL